MKKTILLPLFLGLLLAGCTKTESQKVSANDQSNGSTPPADTSKIDTTKTDQVAATSTTTTPATATTPATDKSTTDATKMASNADTPAGATTSPAPANTAALTPADTAATDMKQPDITARIAEWKLKPDDIKEELQTSGRIVRSKTLGAGEPTGPMDDTLVTQINGKLHADSDTASLKIDVKAEKGVVTLDGTAQSLDQVGKAIALSLDTPGVTQAISLVKVSANQ